MGDYWKYYCITGALRLDSEYRVWQYPCIAEFRMHRITSFLNLSTVEGTVRGLCRSFRWDWFGGGRERKSNLELNIYGNRRGLRSISDVRGDSQTNRVQYCCVIGWTRPRRCNTIVYVNVMYLLSLRIYGRIKKLSILAKNQCQWSVRNRSFFILHAIQMTANNNTVIDYVFIAVRVLTSNTYIQTSYTKLESVF